MSYLFKNLSFSTHLKRYAVNTGWLFAERIIRIVANVLVGVLVARYLGQDGYGLLNYGLAVLAMLVPFAGLGIHSLLVKDIVEEKQSVPAIMGTAFMVRMVGGFISLLVLAGIVTVIDHDPEVRLMILILGLSLVFQAFQVIEYFFHAKVATRIIVKSQVISLIVSSILKVVFVVLKLDVIWFAIATTVEIIVLSLGYLLNYRFAGLHFRHWRYKRDIARKMLREAWPLIFSGFVITLYMRIDQIMIKHMMSDGAAGNYSAAVKISESFNFLPAIILSSLLPAIIYGRKIGEDEYRKRLQNLYNLFTWVAISISVGLFVFADLIAMIYGDKFEGVASVLRVHVWSIVFVFWGMATGKWLIIENKQALELINTIVGSIINIMLNLLLIPKIGIMGAAIATVVAYAYASVFGFIFFRQGRQFFSFIFRSMNPYNAFHSIAGMVKKGDKEHN